MSADFQTGFVFYFESENQSKKTSNLTLILPGTESLLVFATSIQPGQPGQPFSLTRLYTVD